MMDNMMLIQDLTNRELAMLDMEFRKVQKDKTAGILLTLFCGGFGGHRYYMGETGWGVFYTLFFWTLIPAFIAFIELFLISGRIDRYNAERQMEIVTQIKLMRQSEGN